MIRRELTASAQAGTRKRRNWRDECNEFVFLQPVNEQAPLMHP